MQLLMFETSGKGNLKPKPSPPVRAPKDAPVDLVRRVVAADDIDRPSRPQRAEEEADRWDGLY